MYRQIKSNKTIPVSEFRKMKVKPEKTLRQLKDNLDEVFNAYIRKRDTIDGYYFVCISCNEKKPLNQMNATHFHSAGHNEAVRWDERNVNGGCIRCNKFLHGNYGGYLKGMLKKYGPKVVQELEIKRHNKSKMMKFEVQLLIDEYKKKLKE